MDHPAKQPHQSNVGLDWRDQVIYQIMIDRFENGDPNNDFNVAPSVPGRYHGGDRAVDLAGREEHRRGRRVRELSRLLDAGLLAAERSLR